MTNKEIKDRLTIAAADAGWNVEFHEQDDGSSITAEFSMCSPAGEDIRLETEIHAVASVEDIADDLYSAYCDFEVEDHVYELMQASRNGLSGVPDAETLLKDAREIKNLLGDLYDVVRERLNGEEPNQPEATTTSQAVSPVTLYGAIKRSDGEPVPDEMDGKIRIDYIDFGDACLSWQYSEWWVESGFVCFMCSGLEYDEKPMSINDVIGKAVVGAQYYDESKDEEKSEGYTFCYLDFEDEGVMYSVAKNLLNKHPSEAQGICQVSVVIFDGYVSSVHSDEVMDFSWIDMNIGDYPGSEGYEELDKLYEDLSMVPLYPDGAEDAKAYTDDDDERLRVALVVKGTGVVNAYSNKPIKLVVTSVENDPAAVAKASSEKNGIECDSELCVFNPDGYCWAKRMYGVDPILSDDGCSCFCNKPECFEG